jgi:hypothetical protein
MLVLMNKMLEETGKGNLLEIWPNLKYIFMAVWILTRTISKKYFLEKILNITKYTMHPKAFAIQDLNNSSDLLLMLD